MFDRLYLDYETFNGTVDIKAGTYEYARTCEPLLCTYAFDDEPVTAWDCTRERMPEELEFALSSDADCEIWAQNAMFDRNVQRLALGVDTPIDRWRCSMVLAYLHALPGNLEVLGSVLGLPAEQQKIKDGKRLIKKFCTLQPANRKIRRHARETDPEDWGRFVQYAMRDTSAMRECIKLMPTVNATGAGWAGYHLDQKINDRGFQVDTELVAAGVRAAETERANLAERFSEIVGGVVRPSQRAKFCEYLNENYGLGIDNTRAATFLELLKTPENLHSDAIELMRISMLSNKTSTAKYRTLAPAVSPDGRFRGGLQYAGASRTRRWAGRTFQPHNLPSRGLPDQNDIEQYITALKLGGHEFIFDDLMLFGSAALRGVLVASGSGYMLDDPAGVSTSGEKKKLVVADLSNIEGRALAFLAGEGWKLKAFRAFDAGDGPDLYNVTAGSLLGKNPYDISKGERNAMGKVPELALGYQGGFGAFQTFSKAYNIKMAELWGEIQQNLKQEFVQGARHNWFNWGADRVKGDGFDPDEIEDEWIPSEAVKLAWRGRHPATVALWHASEKAARLAIQNPGKVYNAGRHLRFSVRVFGRRKYLLMRLPTGGFLTYFNPEIDDEGTVRYWGVDATAKGGVFGQWRKQYTYGGKFIENACQSLSRDILLHNMHRAEDAGYELSLIHI